MLAEPEILRRICLAGAALMLLLTAWIDGRTGRIPDKYLLVGFALAFNSCVLTTQIKPHLSPIAQILTPLSAALTLGALIWGVNELWYRWRGQDAIGLGDAKWSAVAALAFGVVPVLWAWALAAWPGLVWLGLTRWRGAARPHLHFTPFLAAALLLIQLLRQP